MGPNILRIPKKINLFIKNIPYKKASNNHAIPSKIFNTIMDGSNTTFTISRAILFIAAVADKELGWAVISASFILAHYEADISVTL